MDVENSRWWERRDRQLRHRDGEKLGVTFNGQLTLRDEVADHAVVRRIARRSNRIARTVRLGFRTELVR
jgi:hypothetical protein